MKRCSKNKNIVYVYTLVFVLGLYVAAFLGIKTARAEYNENFDAYTIGDINGQGSWAYNSGAHNFYVSTDRPYSGTSSLKLLSGIGAGTYQLNEAASTSQIFSFYIYIGTSSPGTIVLQAEATSTYLFRVEFVLGAASYDVYFNDGFGSDLFFTAEAYGQWQIISLWINYRSNTVGLSDDGFAYFYKNFWADYLVVSALEFQSPNLSAPTYIDALTTKLLDYGSMINFTSPTAYGNYFLNSFDWSADWSIGLADILINWDNNIYTLIDYTQPDGRRVMTQESGLIKNWGPASEFDPEDVQNWEIDNPLSFPQYLGSYTATVSLVADLGGGSTALLANNILSFTIATGTERTLLDNKDAYCSDLCEDLSVSITSIFDSVTCAGRYIACYAFVPSSYTTNLFKENFNDMTARFPASLFFDITSSTEQAIFETIVESEGFPVILKSATGTRELFTANILTASSVSNMIGYENERRARDAVGGFFWLIAIALALLEVYFFFKR